MLYRLSWLALLPYARLRLWWRARRQPEYALHMGERFGRYAVPRLKANVWVHAVSVGEVRAASGMLKQLLELDCSIVLTVTTPTGRATVMETFASAIESRRLTLVYSPYDVAWIVERFLTQFSPALCVLVETEVWPTQLALLHARGIPAVLINARMSEKSAAAYAARRGVMRPAFASLHRVLAQSAADAQRLTALGANHVETLGNLKFDNTPSSALMALGRAWRATLSPQRRVLLASTTRPGEEALILAASREWLTKSDVLLVLVPRHPQRFDEVGQLVSSTGLTLTRRSAGVPTPQTQVWLGDSMGEMPAYYAMSDVVLMGGSLLKFGAHNLIEAMAQAKPVLIGPHTYNFAQATARGVEGGAVLQAADIDTLIGHAKALLQDPSRCARMGAAGQALVTQSAGATARTLAVLVDILSLTPDPALPTPQSQPIN